MLNMIADNPAQRLKAPAARHHRRGHTRSLEALQDAPMQYRVCSLRAIYSGFRRAELCGLEWKDIDFTSGVITISRTSLYTEERGIYMEPLRQEARCAALSYRLRPCRCSKNTKLIRRPMLRILATCGTIRTGYLPLGMGRLCIRIHCSHGSPSSAKRMGLKRSTNRTVEAWEPECNTSSKTARHLLFLIEQAISSLIA